MAAVTICSDFGAQENKVCHCFYCFPIYLPWSNGIGCHDLHFWTLSYKPTFSLSSFDFIKRLFNSYLLSAIRGGVICISEVDISPGNLDSSFASYSLAFLIMYSAYRLSKQGDNIHPWHTPFPIWNQSFIPYLVLTVASWPAYRFLGRQVRWSSIPISWRIFHNLLWSKQSKAFIWSIKQK